MMVGGFAVAGRLYPWDGLPNTESDGDNKDFRDLGSAIEATDCRHLLEILPGFGADTRQGSRRSYGPGFIRRQLGRGLKIKLRGGGA
jgi:hypothetical protein